MEATATWAQPQVYERDGTYPRELDTLFSEPFLSMIDRPYAYGGRSYGGFIFATYLEEKVANADSIVRKSWEQYQSQYLANGNGSVVNAIETVLQQDYATNLSAVLPHFAWNNYFLNGGTYDRVVNVYRDVENPCYLVNQQVCSQLQQQPEWELFRSWLAVPRNNFQDAHAGVFVLDQVNQFPIEGPTGSKPDWINHLERIPI